jgi:hypothetical protein
MPGHIAFSGDGNRLARVQSAIGSREGAPEVFIWTIGDAKSLFKFPLRPSLGVGPPRLTLSLPTATRRELPRCFAAPST